MRFWFELGVDGFRIDVAHGLAKAEGLPDVGSIVWPPVGSEVVDHPHWDRDEVHDIYRSWRSLADTYDDPRVFVAEAWVHHPERLAQYVRADELHTAFNFDFLLAPWQAEPMRESIIAALAAHEAVGAPATWVLSNHDTVREVSRYARPQGVRPLRKLVDLADLPADFAVGRRRARAAALLMLALPGGAYVYQGEELGLAEVEDLPDEVLQDPGWEQSGRTERGRDGCRVPIPWSGEAPPFGFSPPNASAPPWLPQPVAWRELTVEAETGDECSMLELYRRGAADPPRAAGARRRHASLAGDARRRAGVRARPGIRVHRQLLGRSGGAAGRSGPAAIERSAQRRRAGARGHRRMGKGPRLKSWGLPGPELATRPPASSRAGGPHGSRRAARQSPDPLREWLDVHRHGGVDLDQRAQPEWLDVVFVPELLGRPLVVEMPGDAGSRSWPSTAFARPRADSGTAPRSKSRAVVRDAGPCMGRTCCRVPRRDSTWPSPAAPSPRRGRAVGSPAPSPALPAPPSGLP